TLATGSEEADKPVIPLLQTLIAALEGQESVKMPSDTRKPYEDQDRDKYRRSEVDSESTPKETDTQEQDCTDLERLEEMKKEVLERLQEVQQTIKKDLAELEKSKESEPACQQERIRRQYQINQTQR